MMHNKLWESRLREQIPRLRRYARALTQNAEAADDLVQDCLEKAWDKRDSWQKDSNLRAWLFSIMHNQFINGVRRNKLARDYVQQAQHHVTSTTATDLGLMRDLESCLARLNPEHRVVLLLAGLEGLSYKEIADVTNTPIGTVMSRLSRGRETLRELMSEQQDGKVVRLT